MSLPILAFKKKLYALNPANPPREIQTQRTKRKLRFEAADPASLERRNRELLAHKISGNQVGIWLLIPEHLRLGSWDLLCHWSQADPASVDPRLALHMVHESALCLSSMRKGRTLSQKGFELANGLPFVPSDPAIHDLLNGHTVAQAEQFQIALGKLRRASGHFKGQLLALDPHRLESQSARQMRRHRFNDNVKSKKMMQSFFLVDAHTQQPICFAIASSAQTVTEATPRILQMASEILNPDPAKPKPLILADKEHYSRELIEKTVEDNKFDLLVAVPAKSKSIPEGPFTEHWPGYAITKEAFAFKENPDQSYFLLTQKTGIRPEDLNFQSFLATADQSGLENICSDYPQRWHVEEFFKFNQALGWDKARTFNLNIRYGRMTFALLAQTVIHQLRQRLGEPYRHWDALHFSQQLFQGLEGDVRVEKDTIIVTYYNAPEALKAHYENLPEKLEAEGVKPNIPWLYDFKLDFRFK